MESRVSAEAPDSHCVLIQKAQPSNTQRKVRPPLWAASRLSVCWVSELWRGGAGHSWPS
ncbi:hypothetical protein D3C81_2216260 [compost metagenome]